MIVKTMKMIIATIAGTILIFTVLPGSISAAETAQGTGIPDDLIAAKGKKRNPSLAISVKAVLYKLRQKHEITLIDVRSRQNYEKIKISGAINVPLHFIKTKMYLKGAPIVLINEGFNYSPLEQACRRLSDLGFKAFILDGGLAAWKRNGGRVVGDLFALEDIRQVSPQVFFLEKDYENTLVIDISPIQTEASRQFIPDARHIPIANAPNQWVPKLRRLTDGNKDKPLSSILAFNETGAKYERVEMTLNKMGVDAFYLKGGVAGYQRYLESLVLSRQPRKSRMKIVTNCKPCGEKFKEE